MFDDPIVEEMRALRDQYAKQFNYNLDAICQDLRKQQQQGDRIVVKREPKRPAPIHGGATA